MVYLRHPNAQQPSQQERTKQQGEHFTENLQEGQPESNVGMRLDQRENQRNGNGRQQIGSQRIGSQAGGTATQLACNDGCRRSRRTDQTNHSSLEHFPIQLVHRTEHQQGRNGQTRHRLKQQQPDMPCLGFQFAHLHFAEREQQLGKISNGVRTATSPLMNGLAGANTETLAKRKYANVPATMATGNVQFLRNRINAPIMYTCTFHPSSIGGSPLLSVSPHKIGAKLASIHERCSPSSLNLPKIDGKRIKPKTIPQFSAKLHYICRRIYL